MYVGRNVTLSMILESFKPHTRKCTKLGHYHAARSRKIHGKLVTKLECLTCVQERRKKMKHSMCIFALLLAGASAQAQELPDKPEPRIHLTIHRPPSYIAEQETFTVPHPTSDRAFWLWTAPTVAMAAGDLAMSLSNLGNEANPLVKDHPAIMSTVVVGSTILAVWCGHRWKRQQDTLKANGIQERGPKWWIPDLIVMAGHGLGFGYDLAVASRH